MRRRYIVRRAGNSLKHAKIRTLLTSLAIAVGAFTLTVSMAAGEGSRQYANKLISSNIDPQSLIIAKDKSLFGGASQQPPIREYDANTLNSNGGGPGRTISIKLLTDDDMNRLRQNHNLTNIHPVSNLTVQYMTIQGVNKKYVGDTTQYDPGVRSDVAAGSLPALGSNIDARDAIVPETYVDILGVNNASSLIGKKLTLTIAKPIPQLTQSDISRALATGGVAGLAALTQPETKQIVLTIRAVSRKSATSLSGSQQLQISDTQASAVTEYTTKGTANYHKYMIVTAKAKPDIKPETVKQQLTGQGYTARTAKDLQNLLFTIVNILQGIVAGFGILALLASVFGIINTQYISVLERTQQIGLMKALGMRQRDVAKLFRYEAAWIGFLGGLIGSAIACVAGTLLNPWITEQLSLGDGNSILIFQPLPIAGLIVALMVIAILAGYFPARKAAKLDPIEALRTE